MYSIPYQRYIRRIFSAASLIGLCVAQCQAATGALSAHARTLPPAGTTWCYSIGFPKAAAMTLKGVSAGIASYDIGDAQAGMHIDEQVDTYTPRNPSRHGVRKLLVFPLATGKQWSDEFDEEVTSHLGRDTQWEYGYHAISQSHVLKTEKRQVGAGTYDTFVIERNTAWTKRNPRSSSSMLRSMHCDDPACTVTGYSKEVFWYAPSIGRAVLRVYSQGGDSDYLWNREPDQILKDAGALVTELVDYRNDATCDAPHSPLLARTPSSPWYGFAVRENDTWEFLMQRDMARE